MDSLLNVLHATVAKFSARQATEATLGKLNQFIYLVDWHLRINNRSGISGVNWINGSFGPTSAELEQALQRRVLFEPASYETESGRKVVYFKPIGSPSEVSKDTEKSIQHVSNLYDERASKNLGQIGEEFRRLVLSTYGIMHTEKGDQIDIQRQAADYRKYRGAS